ncbi:MAG: YitT family protein [Lachnospiraceae bacterium]|nr:YitT family protein [Lachnospiraceae bacterium]
MNLQDELYVPPRPLTKKNIGMILIGTVLFSLSVNLFLQPLDLYAGGIVGLSNLFRTLFLPGLSKTVAGIINMCLNIPLFILAWKTMKKKMLVGTLLSLIVQTILMSMVPIPKTPILDDKLANLLISGVVGGIGCGMILSNGGSAGGLDLLGVFIASRNRNFSVGKFETAFNAVLYLVCAILFSIPTALYSILYVICFSLAIDRFHYQNIEIELEIFTHHPEIEDVILNKYVRGVTKWKGVGAYTNEGTNVLITVVAKNEVNFVKRDILEIDPKAFIIEHGSTNVTGGYQKRLDN